METPMSKRKKHWNLPGLLRLKEKDELSLKQFKWWIFGAKNGEICIGNLINWCLYSTERHREPSCLRLSKKILTIQSDTDQ